jgi:hypothetical protein
LWLEIPSVNFVHLLDLNKEHFEKNATIEPAAQKMLQFYIMVIQAIFSNILYLNKQIYCTVLQQLSMQSGIRDKKPM